MRRQSKDFWHLGQFLSWLIYAGPKHKLCLVVGYGVGRCKPKGLKTVYQQTMRYLQNHGLHLKTNPRKMFEDNLVAALKMWKKQCDSLLVGLDMNNNIIKGWLAKRFFEEVGLNKLTHTYWNGEEPHTYINGLDSIDGWYSSDSVECVSVKILSFHDSILR